MPVIAVFSTTTPAIISIVVRVFLLISQQVKEEISAHLMDEEEKHI